MSDLRVSPSSVSLVIRNTGGMDGSEVLQVWLAYTPTASSSSRFARPLRTLGAFSKVFVRSSQEKTVVIPVEKDATAVWDEKRDCWCCERGDYEISVVTSPNQEVLREKLVVEKDHFWSGL